MAPKPRGLKASKKAAPAFDPAAATAAATASGGDGEGRTMPLDQDHLSIADLFELRISAVALLETGDPDKQDEARGLLRGILHGAEDLLALVSEDFDPQSLEEEDEDEETKKLKALGFGDELAMSYLPYLQGFALHELALILPPAERLVPAALSSAQGSKKRKIDLTEPTDPLVWMGESVEKFADAWLAIGEQGGSLWALMLVGGYLRAKVERGALAARKGETGQAEQDVYESGHDGLLSGPSFDVLSDVEGDIQLVDFLEEYGDPVSPFIAGVGSLIALAESTEEMDPEDRNGIIGLANSVLAKQQKVLHEDLKKLKKAEHLKKLAPKWRFDLAVVVADGLLAAFAIKEDAVEAEHRPDAEDGDEGDDEAEVTPLPIDAEDVLEARRAAVQAIAALRASIKLCAELSDAEQVQVLKVAQYRKLEEAYLLYSALFNPDQEKETKEIEDALEQVRKDGGLEVEAAP